jgi:hypothetical protein
LPCAAGVIKGRIYDIAAPDKGLPSIEVVMETAGNKITTVLTNCDGDYLVKVDVQVGASITGRYHDGDDYGAAASTFLLDKEVVEKNVYLFKKESPENVDYYNKAVENTIQNLDVSAWTGGVVGLWKFSDNLGLSTLGKIDLSRVLIKKDPEIASGNPDIVIYNDADPDTVNSFTAFVQASLDKDHRLPTKNQAQEVAPQTTILPKEVIADVFGTKLAKKPEIKENEVDQLGMTWGQDIKNKTRDNLVKKEAIVVPNTILQD